GEPRRGVPEDAVRGEERVRGRAVRPGPGHRAGRGGGREQDRAQVAEHRELRRGRRLGGRLVKRGGRGGVCDPATRSTRTVDAAPYPGTGATSKCSFCGLAASRIFASAASTFFVSAARSSLSLGSASFACAFCDRLRHSLTTVSFATTAARIARDWATIGLAAFGSTGRAVRFTPAASCFPESRAHGTPLIFNR